MYISVLKKILREAISFLQERYTAEGIPFTIDTADCVMEDWLNNWKKYFKPIPVENPY